MTVQIDEESCALVVRYDVDDIEHPDMTGAQRYEVLKAVAKNYDPMYPITTEMLCEKAAYMFTNGMLKEVNEFTHDVWMYRINSKSKVALFGINKGKWENSEKHTLSLPYSLYGDEVLAIDAEAFSGLEMVVLKLPECLRKIGARAFKGCNNLRDVNIPENVVFIGEEAFAQSRGLMTIRIPDNVVLYANSFTEEFYEFYKEHMECLGGQYVYAGGGNWLYRRRY